MSFSPNIDYPDFLKTFTVALFLAFIFTGISCRKTSNEIPNHPAYADRIIDHADSLVNTGQLGHSLTYLDSAYKTFPQPGPVDLWKKYKEILIYYLNYDAEPIKARLYSDSMFMALKGLEETYKEQYTWTLFYDGDVFMAERKYIEAFKYYYDGRVFAQKNLDSCSFSQFSHKLGIVRYKQEQYLKAIPYLKQALAESRHCKAGSGFYNLFSAPQSYLNTTALCYEKAGMLDSALYYYNCGLVFINQRAKRFPEKKQFVAVATGVFYGNIGGVYAKMKNYEKAEKYLKADIRINNHPDYAIGDARTAEIKLAGLYLQFARYKEADTVLQQLKADLSTDRGKNEGTQDTWLRWYKLKWEESDRTGASLQAYQYMKKYYSLRDSISEVNEGSKNIDMDKAFKDNREQYNLALLSKDNKLKTTYLVTVFIFSIMAICILAVVWFNLKRSRRANQQITKQNTQMRQALNALEQSQEDNTRMMQIVAHDLRNPIGGITSAVSLMLLEEDRSTEDQEMLELIKISGQNSLELVSDLLQVQTRLEELKKEPVDLSVMLHYCVDLLHYKAESKGQRIVLKTVPITISANREKLWRVVSNLITNAIKFSPSGANIYVAMQEKTHQVLISVEDNGIGIPDEVKDKIFDMYTEARRHGTAGEQPFGLGLAISKQIVEAHGGRIWFDSKPGKGTTFFIELPISA